MDTNKIIACKCLYGYIRHTNKPEKKRCLNEIQKKYGKQVRDIVENYLGHPRG